MRVDSIAHWKQRPCDSIIDADGGQVFWDESFFAKSFYDTTLKSKNKQEHERTDTYRSSLMATPWYNWTQSWI